MQTAYFIWSPLLSASELNSFFNGMSQKQKRQLPKHECLIVLFHCTSSLDSLLGEELVFQPQSEKKLTQTKLFPIAECRKWIFPLSDTSPHSLIMVQTALSLWDTRSKYRWHHAVQISDSTDFNFWTNSQIYVLLFCNLSFL